MIFSGTFYNQNGYYWVLFIIKFYNIEILNKNKIVHTHTNTHTHTYILDSSPFKHRLPSNITYFRCIDDILIFPPQNVKIEEITGKLNNVESSINFTYEKQSNYTIPFLHILIIKSHNNLTFKVYCKPTSKNDYIHFYSHHNKIQTSLIIGFYQRAFRICTQQYQDEEFEYIEHSLKSLKYPKFFILNAREKALKVHSSYKSKKNNPTYIYLYIFIEE